MTLKGCKVIGKNSYHFIFVVRQGLINKGLGLP